jgi:hypothetical protein
MTALSLLQKPRCLSSKRRGGVVLFPVRLDNAVFTSSEARAAKLRDNRHIGDFRKWKDHDAYQRTLERLLRATSASRQHNVAYGVVCRLSGGATGPDDAGP